jgi:hypothetical protein
MVGSSSGSLRRLGQRSFRNENRGSNPLPTAIKWSVRLADSFKKDNLKSN